MLEKIYDMNREEIDNCIKNAIKKVEGKLYKIDYDENRDLIEKIEENYNIKLGAICKEIYIKGFKDGINLIKEFEEKL